jgi:hypothetical protein
MASALALLAIWNNLIECLHLVHVDNNHQMAVEQLHGQKREQKG